jgi:hypothetical protein
MRNLIVSFLFVLFGAAAVQGQSTFYTVPQLEEAINGDRIIAFWTYLHKQGSSNLALKGIRLDSLFIALDNNITGGGGGGGTNYQTMQEEGTDLAQRAKLNFVGSSATASDNVTKTDVTFDSDLNALASTTTNGLYVRTGSGTSATRTITAGTGISVSNGDGISGNPTITNSSPDQTVSLTNGGGISITGTYPTFTLTAAVTTAYATVEEEGTPLTQRSTINFIGSSATAADNVSKTDVTFDSDLNALASIATNGLYIRTGTGTSVTRTITAGTGISVSNGDGVSGNPTITNSAPDQTVSLTGDLGMNITGAYPNFTIALPTGTTNYTMRYDGADWVQSGQIQNNNGQVGIGIAPNASYELLVDGATKINASIVSEGAGAATSTLLSPTIRLLNTTPTTGDTWYLHSSNLGEYELWGGNAGKTMIAETDGTIAMIYDLSIGLLSGTPTKLTGVDASGLVGQITIGSGLLLSGGSLSATGGGAANYQIIQDEGTPLTARNIFNFVGTSATAADDVVNSRTNITFDSDLDALASTASTGIYIVTGVGTSATRTLTGPAAGITVTNGNGVSGNPTLALANDLAGVEGLSGTGLAVRTATDTWTNRTLTPGTGISITNANGVSGNPTITNSAPDQTVSLTNGGGISITGTYPTFTLTAAVTTAYATVEEEGTPLTPTFTLTAAVTTAYATVEEEGTPLTQRSTINFIGSSATAADNVSKTDVTFDSDLNALASTTSTGLYVRTGTGTSTTRTLTGPAAGITVTNGNGVSGNPTLALANDLAGVEGLAGTGLAIRTATDTWTNRSVVAGTGAVTITNGDGISGNITVNNTDPDQSTTNEVLTISDGTDSEALGGQTLTVTGAGGITADYVIATNTLTITGSGGGGTNYQTMQEEGTGLTQRPTFNFIGTTATAADDLPNTRTNITFDSDVDALASSTTTGLYVITGTGTSATRTLTAPAAGITVTNGNGVSGNPTLALANDLAGVEGLATTGIPVRTATDTWTTRSITAGTGISVSNGDGVSGNPVITNSSPDQVVSLTNGGGVTITGSYPNFTLTAAVTTAYATVQEEGTGLTQRSIINFIGSSATAADNVSKTDVTFDSDLNALASTASSGLYAVTGTGTSATRTITGPAAGITVTNGNGVSGNPTLALANDLAGVEGLSGTGLAVRTAADSWTNRSVVAGTGAISITNGDGVSGNITINNTDPDQSTTNELQTLVNTNDATSHTTTLSNSGGSLKLAEGANITLTTTGTGSDAIVTIASTGGGGGTPAGGDFQVQYYNGGAFGAESVFNYNPTNNRLVVGHTTTAAVLHARGADDVADRVILAENASGNDVVGIYATGKMKWGDNEAYPVIYQTPSSGGTPSYTSNGLTFESSLAASTGVDLFGFNHPSATNNSGGPYNVVRASGTWAPTSGSAVYNGITSNATINATSTATGKVNMFNGNPIVTQATGGVNIFNASPVITNSSGGMVGYYSNIGVASGFYQLFMDGLAQSRFDGPVGIKTDPAANYDLHVTGATRVDATIESRGTGTAPSGLQAAAVRLINTAGGDTWYLGSNNDGSFTLVSGNSSVVLTGSAAGKVSTTYDFRIGDVTGFVPTTIIGREGDGDVGTVTLGSGVTLSGGELPLWNSKKIPGIVSLTTTALADVTGLSFAVDANKKYEFRAVIKYSAAATTTGSAWSINGPAGSVSLHTMSGTSNIGAADTWQNAVNTNNASPQSAYTSGNIAIIEGIVEPTASGTYIIRGATEVGGSAITVQGVSVINWREIK